MSHISSQKRIAKNTIILYIRMIFLMLVTLYTSRVILEALGVEDYGIYNVVGGFVSMFALISAALTSACTRFLNFEMGNSDLDRQNVVFSTAVAIQWILAIIIFVLAEIVGVWYVNNIMVLPPERLSAANWCFQFSVLNFCMNIITVPYNASIIAHERMKTFAYVSIYEGLAKLLVAFLVFKNPFDRLVYYALMLFLIQFSVRYLYQYYSRKHFEECHYKRVFDKPLVKQMLGYSVWHLLGNGAVILKTHGVNLVLNVFFGPVVNAARGLAGQVDAAVSQFTNNFMMAMNPQITQSYAKGDLNYMFNLVEKGARFSFYLVLFLSLPIIVNTDYILSIWLKEVPIYTVPFVQLTLACLLISALSKPLITAQNATGNVRNYQLIIGGINLLNLPVSYLWLWLGGSPVTVVIVAIIIEIISFFGRVYLIPNTIPEFCASHYFKVVGGEAFIVALLACPLPIIMHHYFHTGISSFVLNCLFCVIITGIVVLFVGCKQNERRIILTKIEDIRKMVNK